MLGKAASAGLPEAKKALDDLITTADSKDQAQAKTVQPSISGTNDFAAASAVLERQGARPLSAQPRFNNAPDNATKWAEVGLQLLGLFLESRRSIPTPPPCPSLQIQYFDFRNTYNFQNSTNFMWTRPNRGY